MKPALIIEDDQALREIICLFLTEEGYEAVGATDGADALRALESFAPVIILLDLMMPEMTGWEFLHALEMRPEMDGIPVIVASACPPELCTLPRATAVLAKPLDLDLLGSAIGQALDDAGAGVTRPRSDATLADSHC